MQQKLKISKSRSSNFNMMIVFSLLLVFGFFFSSKLLLWDDSPFIQTAYGKSDNTLKSSEITLDSWEFNEKTGLMEIKITAVPSSETAPDLIFSAKEKDHPRVEIPVKVAAHIDNKYTLILEKIPADFKAVGIVITEKGQKEKVKISNLDLFEPENIQNEDTQSSKKDDDVKSLTLYGDYRKVERNNNLKPLSEQDYVLESIKSQINAYKDHIKELEGYLPGIDENIADFNDQIKAIEEEKQYMTASEINDANKDIESLNKRIEEENANKEKVNAAIETTNEKLVKVTERYNDEEKK
jgi:prefoldin subunit 5